MDEPYLYHAARYVELNPVRAGICAAAMDYRWSSAQAHLGMRSDKYVTIEPLLLRFLEWRSYLKEPSDEISNNLIRKHSATGRPFGSQDFVAILEQITGRILAPQKRGPKSSTTG